MINIWIKVTSRQGTSYTETREYQLPIFCTLLQSIGDFGGNIAKVFKDIEECNEMPYELAIRLFALPGVESVWMSKHSFVIIRNLTHAEQLTPLTFDTKVIDAVMKVVKETLRSSHELEATPSKEELPSK